MVHDNGMRFLVTQAGTDWLGTDFERLPTGAALRDYWLEKLPEGESRIFEAVLIARGMTRDAIGEVAGYKRSTRNTYIQRLAARELVIAEGEMIRPSETLFE